MEKYEALEMEVICFEAEDVITTSGMQAMWAGMDEEEVEE